jgi:diaminobutyrate-2-oxoglutarate transaminase
MIDFIESDVRSYSRSYPAIFDSAQGSFLYDTSGQKYLDFLSGCGSLNYGHNNPKLKSALLSYIERNGLSMSMDLRTVARQHFISNMKNVILEPRGLQYKFQFPGPTGTNCVEAAIKLARKVTGRQNVISFTNGFHGCTLGSLALTGSSHHRSSSTGHLHNVTRIPYDGYFGSDIDTGDFLDKLLSDKSSGVDIPAAIILETVQGEGGLNSCSQDWAKNIQRISRKYDSALIIDDIQAGCGRTGTFFSFDSLGIEPDLVCLAKSISGFGLPMSMLLIKPDWDQWQAGEHNGTFRGNNLAFVTASEALLSYWSDESLMSHVHELSDTLREHLEKLSHNHSLTTVGRGLMSGLRFSSGADAAAVKKACFEKKLIIECSGPDDEVLKFLPALTTSVDDLHHGLSIVDSVITDVIVPSRMIT